MTGRVVTPGPQVSEETQDRGSGHFRWPGAPSRASRQRTKIMMPRGRRRRVPRQIYRSSEFSEGAFRSLLIASESSMSSPIRRVPIAWTTVYALSTGEVFLRTAVWDCP